MSFGASFNFFVARSLRVVRRALGGQRETQSESTSTPRGAILGKAVIAHVSGGLANQMLCYKMARCIADKANASLILECTFYGSMDTDSARNFQLQHHRVRFDLLLFSKSALREIEQSNEITYITREMLQKEPDATRMMSYVLEQPIVFCDLWLALKARDYFDDYAESNGVLDDLEVKIEQCFLPADDECYRLIRDLSDPVAIHVRRGDFATHDGNLLLTLDYYNRAIAQMEARVESPVFFVFSDDIPWCKTHLRSRSRLHFVDWHDDREGYKDMFLASKCRHFILSNESTFSHQAVQLNRMPVGRIVITSTQEDLVRNVTAGSEEGIKVPKSAEETVGSGG